MNRTV